jgi:hypothetical protein
MWNRELAKTLDFGLKMKGFAAKILMLTFMNVLQVTYSRGYLNPGHAAAGPFMQ